MKHFLITLLLCASSLHAQNPLEGEWITSSLLRNLKAESQNLLVLTQRERERSGFAMEFKKDDKNQYISYYFAPCGNDCFRSVSGTFELIAPSYVRLNALTFEQHGDCKKINKTLHNDTADYYIYKVSDKKIFLVKSTSKNEKEDQEKAENYLLITGIKDNILYDRKHKMKVEAKGIELPAQVEKYATNILQLKEFKILVYNQLERRAAWVFAVKDLATGAITYVIQENYYDAKDNKGMSRFFDCTEAEIKKFRQ